MTDYMAYQSPFTNRYGSMLMRDIWSEKVKRMAWRRVWAELATTQAEYGLLPEGHVRTILRNVSNIDVDKSLKIEKRTKHDVAAELELFTEQCGQAGASLHLGATSSDIEDNASILQQVAAVRILFSRMKSLLESLLLFIEKNGQTVCMGYTHWQPAVPTTMGYRICLYVQDLFDDIRNLIEMEERIGGKGFTGAVGTSASYVHLMEHMDNPVSAAQKMSAKAMDAMDMDRFLVTGQTYPRKQDFMLLNVLAGIAASLHKLALDVRTLQSPGFGELVSEKSAGQVGSTAMPYKTNPIGAEGICSLARLVAQMPRTAWDNAANSGLERTLDDKANRRVILPEAFLAVDEMLLKAARMVRGLSIDEEQISQNLARFGAYAGTERLLIAAVKKGADRALIHSVIDQYARKATTTNKPGHIYALANDDRIKLWVKPEVALLMLLDANKWIGQAHERTATVTRKAEGVMGVLQALLDQQDDLNDAKRAAQQARCA